MCLSLSLSTRVFFVFFLDFSIATNMNANATIRELIQTHTTPMMNTKKAINSFIIICINSPRSIIQKREKTPTTTTCRASMWVCVRVCDSPTPNVNGCARVCGMDRSRSSVSTCVSARGNIRCGCGQWATVWWRAHTLTSHRCSRHSL